LPVISVRFSTSLYAPALFLTVDRARAFFTNLKNLTFPRTPGDKSKRKIRNGGISRSASTIQAIPPPDSSSSEMIASRRRRGSHDARLRYCPIPREHVTRRTRLNHSSCLLLPPSPCPSSVVSRSASSLGSPRERRASATLGARKEARGPRNGDSGSPKRDGERGEEERRRKEGDGGGEINISCERAPKQPAGQLNSRQSGACAFLFFFFFFLPRRSLPPPPPSCACENSSSYFSSVFSFPRLAQMLVPE